jgi:mono/diheme cytochrome c family protein
MSGPLSHFRIGWRPARRRTRSARPLICATGACVLLVATTAAPAQDGAADTAPVFSPGFSFVEKDGAALYANVCQACHMADGRGAAGAGRYPALAGDANLAESGYALTVVVRGLKGMPPVGRMMSDEQVAAVVNYVRTHFGNAYAEVVTAADAAAARR